MNTKPKIVAIVGPTSSGKTSLSIELSKQFKGEVISADSRQVYKDLDIGTGKITKAEMDGVPHHLIDMVEPNQIYTANDFVRDAKNAISKIIKNKHVPIIAGGTFFYIDLLRGKMQSAEVEPDQTFRESLENHTNEELVELLRTKDSKRADNIDLHNRRRIVRSLEIIETLGSVPEQKETTTDYNWMMVGIDIDKQMLRGKFSNRLTKWLEQGLLEEVQEMREQLSNERFLELGFEYTLTAEFLDKKIPQEEFFEKFVQKNWQYAKRQMTWLKRDQSIEWFKPDNRKAIFQRVEEFLNNN